MGNPGSFVGEHVFTTSLLRPADLFLVWSKRLAHRLKRHWVMTWFLIGDVLPLLILTRRRPVLCSRYMALGDVICTFPAVRQLKKRHPGAAFIYHCRQDYACLPRMGGVTTHIVSDLNLNRLETTFAFLFGGIYKFTYGDERENSASTESVIEEYCRQHGVPISAAHPQLQINPAYISSAKGVLKNAGLDKSGPVIAIHPGPSGPFREWHGESWAHLVQALKRAGFHNILQLGASRSDDVGAALRARIPDVVSLADQLSLEQSIAVISLCDVLVGIDSGLLHIAASVGTPFVGLFGPTSPHLRFAADTDRLCVVSRVKCQGCHHQVPRLHWVTGCPCNFDCMKSIQVDDVLQACVSSLKRKKG